MLRFNLVLFGLGYKASDITVIRLFFQHERVLILGSRAFSSVLLYMQT